MLSKNNIDNKNDQSANSAIHKIIHIHAGLTRLEVTSKISIVINQHRKDIKMLSFQCYLRNIDTICLLTNVNSLLMLPNLYQT